MKALLSLSFEFLKIPKIPKIFNKKETYKSKLKLGLSIEIFLRVCEKKSQLLLEILLCQKELPELRK